MVDLSDRLIGRTVLVGLTFRDWDGTLLDREQLFGTIERSDSRGITLRLQDGSTYELPPAPEMLQPARPGEYRLRKTNQVIVDPDLLVVATVTRPARH
ncbi:MAG: hypothetical protein JST54_20780 [Deltaproteobacteria bacterium]|nr:hypothetical protein [Deltaproteobacteria bacterium]